jgi:hypothetical protein
MRLLAVFLKTTACLLWFFQAGTSMAGSLPPEHPANKFKNIASKGPTTSGECRKHGGIELENTIVEKIVDQGVTIVRRNGKRYLGISYGETSYAFLTTVKTCGWELN